jgi:hypothetical protein
LEVKNDFFKFLCRELKKHSVKKFFAKCFFFAKSFLFALGKKKLLCREFLNLLLAKYSLPRVFLFDSRQRTCGELAEEVVAQRQIILLCYANGASIGEAVTPRRAGATSPSGRAGGSAAPAARPPTRGAPRPAPCAVPQGTAHCSVVDVAVVSLTVPKCPWQHSKDTILSIL